MKTWFAIWIVAALVAAMSPAAWAHGAIDERLAIANQRIAADANNPDVFIQRGKLYTDHGDWPAAAADFDRAYALWPGLLAVAYHRGVLWAKAGKPEKALAYLVDFLSQVRDHAHGYHVRAEVFAALGQPRAAAADYDTAIRLYREPRPQIYLDRARVLQAWEPGDVRRIIDGLEDGLGRLGAIPVLITRVLDVETNNGRHREALARIKALPENLRTQPMWLLQRARILRELGDKSGARDAYQAVLDTIDGLSTRQRQTPMIQRLRSQSFTALIALKP